MVRQQEDLKSRLTYKEIEVKALLSAIHGAAGNAKGVAMAEKFSFHRAEPEVASTRKVAQFFKPDAAGLVSDAELAAAVEELKAKRGEQ